MARKPANTTDFTLSKQSPPPQLTPWQPGQSGNPKGRPKGARSKLGEAFLDAMLTDFEAHGVAAIVKVREEKPDAYLRVVADLLPKDVKVSVDDDVAEVASNLSAVAAFLGKFAEAGVSFPHAGAGDDGSVLSAAVSAQPARH